MYVAHRTFAGFSAVACLCVNVRLSIFGLVVMLL